MRFGKRCILILGTFLINSFNYHQNVFAATLSPGGSATTPAVEAYTSWMQFAEPDTHTPAIDTDGCLNYALAKMTVRYNLPIPDVNLFTDSYSYYCSFTKDVLTSSSLSKMQCIEQAYCNFLTQEDSISLHGTMAERFTQAYAFCAENGYDNTWCYILEIKTAHDSTHYVMVDFVDLKQERLYLLDSGSWYTKYLGDTYTIEKGYSVTTIYPFRIQAMPGDCDGDLQLTEHDARILLQQYNEQAIENGDANHDGIINIADAVYIAQAAQKL